MSKKDKKKLCWNCEGSTSRIESNCPYCGVYLHPNEEAWEDDEEELSIEPPYKPEVKAKDEAFSNAALPTDTPLSAQTPNEMRHVFFPLSCLLGGSIFLFFGLILFFFSDQGVLTLQWNAAYWSVYFLISLPLLWIGWNYLSPYDIPSQEKTSKILGNEGVKNHSSSLSPLSTE